MRKYAKTFNASQLARFISFENIARALNNNRTETVNITGNRVRNEICGFIFRVELLPEILTDTSVAGISDRIIRLGEYEPKIKDILDNPHTLITNTVDVLVALRDSEEEEATRILEDLAASTHSYEYNILIQEVALNRHDLSFYITEPPVNVDGNPSELDSQEVMNIVGATPANERRASHANSLDIILRRTKLELEFFRETLIYGGKFDLSFINTEDLFLLVENFNEIKVSGTAVEIGGQGYGGNSDEVLQDFYFTLKIEGNANTGNQNFPNLPDIFDEQTVPLVANGTTIGNPALLLTAPCPPYWIHPTRTRSSYYLTARNSIWWANIIHLLLPPFIANPILNFVVSSKSIRKRQIERATLTTAYWRLFTKNPDKYIGRKNNGFKINKGLFIGQYQPPPVLIQEK